MITISDNICDVTDLQQLIKRGRIRATANKAITPEIAAKIGVAFGTYLGGKGIIVVGREYNNSNRMLKRAFMAGVMSTGVTAMNLHASGVPVLQFCVRRFGANGGVYFSTGASLEGEVTIRFFDQSGVEYNDKNMISINEYFTNNNFHRANPLEVGTISDIPGTHDIYRKAVVQKIDQKLIQSKNLRVVMDCSYGPCGITAPGTLSDVKVDMIALNSYESDRTSNQVYPNLNSIKTCVNIVKASDADLGVVVDGDGSRALFVDDQGNMLSYEDLMMLFISYEESIKKAKGSTIISSESSSQVLDEFIQKKGYNVIKSTNYPGEISHLLHEERACFGGADTFKYYFPDYGPFSDATFTILKVLEILAKQNAPLSQLVRSFPRMVHAAKTLTIPSEKWASFHEDLKIKLRTLKNDTLDYQDIILGIKMLYQDEGYISIIPSLTDETVDLIAEGKESVDPEDLITRVEAIINEMYEPTE